MSDEKGARASGWPLQRGRLKYLWRKHVGYEFSAVLPLLFTTLWLALPVSFAAEQGYKAETISATNFRAIQAALPEFERRKLSLNDYRITVLEFPESQSSLFVMFHDPDIPLGKTVGSSGPRPDFEVEINKHDFRVVKANFVR